ncbi:DUF427 domain-containing protein [Mesobacterium sp. TK19101]|uniref:DUF427 domain-containing protein n=1 Tax=Mesobacterium hydrothermale TaxID=3111907 RepID=A0ABU6HHJ1_9RHOB|nr:DUF427 domain-containing protein [Mesobacterium sp. TK19101]MEC3861930.1 DUF427 domain-containing protein [Mesobacterium sp. TK19101]
MPKHLKIRPAAGKWVVRAGGAVMGESAAALELIEGDRTPVIYFPREDMGMAFLEPSEQTTNCPHKGVATYFSIVTKSKTLENAAWSYEAPTEDASEIKGYLAFYTGPDVTVEQL